jgi:predicted PurR-regulated permease PerM
MKGQNRFVFVGTLIVLLIVSFFIVLPFITPIIFALLLSFIFYPVHKYFSNYLENKTFSAILVSFIVVLILTMPFYFSVKQVAGDIKSVYDTIDGIPTTDLLDTECVTIEGPVCKTLDFFSQYIDKDTVIRVLSQVGTMIVSFSGRIASTLLLSIPLFFLDVTIMFIVLFYFLRDGDVFLKKLKSVLPFDKKHTKEMFYSLHNMFDALLYGQIITAIIQGIIGGIGFYIFGVNNALFWGMIMVFLSILPFIGAWLVWFPAVFYLIIAGIILGDTTLVFQGVGLAAYCGILVSFSDNFFRTYIVADKAKMHPLLMILGVFGGVVVFGVTGFILGPLILAFFSIFLDIYMRDLQG